MEAMRYERALIVGSGSALSASLARLFAREGVKVALAARDTGKLAALCKEAGARAFACEAADAGQVARLFTDVEKQVGEPDVVVYNPSSRTRGPITEIEPKDVERAL